ncbi:MAG: hypothetical protein HZC47_08885 [Methanobacterium sp.]|uniref:hypothetical protein n=1 Tax=Methanobacterium sp. TaxID=2164 RepID=UPI003D65CC8C|nr:hypothetical protein [Methanobacterium sp.]
MWESIAQILLIIGFLVLITGIIVVLCARYSKRIRIESLPSHELRYSQLSKITGFGQIAYTIPVVLRVNLKLKNGLKNSIIYEVKGIPMDFDRDPKTGIEINKYAHHIPKKKKEKSGKYCDFKLLPHHSHELSIKMPDEKNVNGVLTIENIEFPDGNPIIGDFSLEIFEVERPYKKNYTLGLALLPVGTTILMAGISIFATYFGK